MKRYLLLRDSQGKGPFTFEDLSGLVLKWNDLIWIEGQSTTWQYLNEIDELKPLIKASDSTHSQIQRPLLLKGWNGKASPFILSLPNTDDSFHNCKNEEPEPEATHPKKSEEPGTKKEEFRNKALYNSYGLWATLLFLLLMGTAWMVKLAIDVFQGKGLTSIKVTHVAAPLKALPEGVSPFREEDAVYQNALSREIVPVDTILEKEPIKKTPGLKELKKLLHIESNDYKVGVFGGISDLQLTVFNNSLHILDKVVLQVDYLKPNGESLQTDKYSFFSIAPYGKKTLDIPPCRRGVKVKYKILDAKSREYKLSLIQA